MSESSLAAEDGEQETGIQVDLDSDDPGKSVTRVRQSRAPAAKQPPLDSYQQRMSRDMKKRMARLEGSFNQKLAEQQAEFQRQLAERDKRLEALKRGDSDAPGADDAAHEKAMEELQAKLIEAQESGNSAEVARLTRQMTTLDGKFWASKAAKAGVVDKTNQPAAAASTQGNGPGVGGRQPTKAGVAWAKANGDWWNDTTDDVANEARAYATAVHHRKLRDGDDPEDPAYFEEIGQLVRKRFPEIDVKAAVKRRAAQIDDDPDDADGEDDTMDDRSHRNPRRAAPPLMPNRGDNVRRPGNIRTLTQADIRLMKEVGMNPDDNKHVVQWLRSQNELETEA